MASIEIVETGPGTPPVLLVPMSALGSQPGGIVSAVGTGSPARLDYTQQHRSAGMIIPAEDIPAYLKSKGIDPAVLPEPGKAALYAV